MLVTLMRNCGQKVMEAGKKVSNKILETRMMPMFTKLLVISIPASNVLGCSSRCTILLKEGCLLVFKTLMSLLEREKKATSLPATKKEIIKRMMAIKNKTVVAPGVMAKK